MAQEVFTAMAEHGIVPLPEAARVPGRCIDERGGLP